MASFWTRVSSIDKVFAAISAKQKEAPVVAAAAPLSKEEKEKAVFRHFDADSDGLLTRTEFKALMKMCADNDSNIAALVEQEGGLEKCVKITFDDGDIKRA